MDAAMEGDPGLVHRLAGGPNLLSVETLASIPSRRIIDGQLDVHPRENAIVVHYAVEAVVLSEYGELMVADRKECSKL